MEKREEFWKKLRKGLYVLLALTLLVTLGISAYVEYLLNRMNTETDISVQTEQTYTAQPNSLPVTDTSDVSDQTGHINILLIGQDKRAGQTKNARSDAMILCTVNRESKTITLTSFMRDMYVPIPGKKNNRINAAYAMGGIKLLNACLAQNFEIAVDGNVVVDFAAFMEIVDLVGGVDVELSKKEAAYLNSTTYRDQAQWQTDLEEGVNHLDGNCALAYARIRKISGNDFGRTQRQRKVLAALLEKASKLTLPEIHRLLKTISQEISTDMTNAQILGYAIELLPQLKNYKIQTQQIPAPGTYRNATIDGMQVLVPNLERNKQILQNIIS